MMLAERTPAFRVHNVSFTSRGTVLIIRVTCEEVVAKYVDSLILISSTG